MNGRIHPVQFEAAIMAWDGTVSATVEDDTHVVKGKLWSPVTSHYTQTYARAEEAVNNVACVAGTSSIHF